MDTDELDRWLDADEDDGRTGSGTDGTGAGWPGAAPASPPGRRAGGRPRWLVPVGAAVAVWVAVMGVLLIGGDDGADPAGTGASEGAVDPATAGMVDDGSSMAGAPLAGGPVSGAAQGGTATDGVLDPMPAEGVPAATAVPASPAAAADGAAGQTLPVPDLGPLHGAAVSVLRVQLTGSAEGRDRYLEHATPVAVRSLGDGVVVVLLDAVWLEGAEGQLTDVHQGRWSVPMADDATPLGTAWQVAGAPTPPAPAVEPPLGTLRLPEVEQAMAAAGWTEVVAAAADPHPFLDEVVVALVQGISPSGAARAGDVVWLSSAGEGLELLGAAP